MKNDIWLTGEVGFDITLKNLLQSVKESDSDKPLNIHIHSGGGNVFEGLAIYNYLKGLSQEVNTISGGLIASIASIMFLAGNKETRKITDTDNFLIHLPSNLSMGNAEDLEKAAEQLRDIEQKLANIYAKETDITIEEAIDLMKKEDFLDVNFLKEKGFVSEIIEFKAVAKFNKNNDMSDTLTKEKTEGWFKEFMAKYFPKAEPQNKIVQDANGKEIDFTDLADDDTPKVGDKAMVDGAKASGDFVMPSGDTWKFTDGELSEIVAADDDDDDDETLEDVQAERDSLKTQLADATAKATEDKTTIENHAKKIKDMKIDVTDLKNKITSSFSHNGKLNPKTGEPFLEGTRNLFKEQE